jgi:hypothetical protein
VWKWPGNWYVLHHFWCNWRNRGVLKGLRAGDAKKPMFHQRFFAGRTWAKVWKVWTKRGAWKVVCFGAIIGRFDALGWLFENKDCRIKGMKGGFGTGSCKGNNKCNRRSPSGMTNREAKATADPLRG